MFGFRERNALTDSEAKQSGTLTENSTFPRRSGPMEKPASSPFAHVQTSRYFSQVKRTSSFRNQTLTDADVYREITNFLLPGKTSKVIVETAPGNFCLDGEYTLASGKWTAEEVQNFLLFETEYKRNVREMQHFVENRCTQLDLVPFCTTLKSFLEELTEEITGLFTAQEPERAVDIKKAKIRLAWIERRVNRVYRFLMPLIDSRETVDSTWDRFCQAMIIQPDIDDDLPIWRKLYSLMMPQMLAYFDEISEARSDSVFRENESDETTPPVFENARLSFRMLWSPTLYANMLAAIKNASRITAHGERFPQKRRFSELVRESLEEATGNAESEHRPNVITKALEEAAVAYGRQFSDYMFTRLLENNLLSRRLEETKTIFTFTALCWHVNRVYENHDAFGSNSERLAALQKALHSSTLDSDAWKRWKISGVDSEKHLIFRVEPKLEWPLAYILDERLFKALNDCLELTLKVTYALNSAITVSTHHNLGRIHHEYDSARGKRYLCSLLTQFTSQLQSALINQIKILMDRNIAQVLKSQSIAEMEECVSQWTNQAKQLLDSESMEGLYVHTVVDGMSELIEQFRVNAENTSDAKVEKMVNKVHRLRSLISAGSDLYASEPSPIARIARLISKSA